MTYNTRSHKCKYFLSVCTGSRRDIACSTSVCYRVGTCHNAKRDIATPIGSRWPILRIPSSPVGQRVHHPRHLIFFRETYRVPQSTHETSFCFAGGGACCTENGSKSLLSLAGYFLCEYVGSESVWTWSIDTLLEARRGYPVDPLPSLGLLVLYAYRASLHTSGLHWIS